MYNLRNFEELRYVSEDQQLLTGTCSRDFVLFPGVKVVVPHTNINVHFCKHQTVSLIRDLLRTIRDVLLNYRPRAWDPTGLI
jgi:hypothetical protein